MKQEVISWEVDNTAEPTLFVSLRVGKAPIGVGIKMEELNAVMVNGGEFFVYQVKDYNEVNGFTFGEKFNLIPELVAGFTRAWEKAAEATYDYYGE